MNEDEDEDADHTPTDTAKVITLWLMASSSWLCLWLTVQLSAHAGPGIHCSTVLELCLMLS